jgi:hypothetical protein
MEITVPKILNPLPDGRGSVRACSRMLISTLKQKTERLN